MKYFKHNDKEILFEIRHDYSKPRGKNKTLILYLKDYFIKENSLRIPFEGFDKDCKGDKFMDNLIDKHIGRIEKWIAAPKFPVRTITLKFSSKTFVDDYCNFIAGK